MIQKMLVILCLLISNKVVQKELHYQQQSENLYDVNQNEIISPQQQSLFHYNKYFQKKFGDQQEKFYETKDHSEMDHQQQYFDQDDDYNIKLEAEQMQDKTFILEDRETVLNDQDFDNFKYINQDSNNLIAKYQDNNSGNEQIHLQSLNKIQRMQLINSQQSTALFDLIHKGQKQGPPKIIVHENSIYIYDPFIFKNQDYLNKQYYLSEENEMNHFKIESLEMLKDYLNLQQYYIQTLSIVDDEKMLPFDYQKQMVVLSDQSESQSSQQKIQNGQNNKLPELYIDPNIFQQKYQITSDYSKKNVQMTFYGQIFDNKLIDFEKIYNLVIEMPLIIFFITVFSIFLFASGLYFGKWLEDSKIQKIDLKIENTDQSLQIKDQINELINSSANQIKKQKSISSKKNQNDQDEKASQFSEYLSKAQEANFIVNKRIESPLKLQKRTRFFSQGENDLQYTVNNLNITIRNRQQSIDQLRHKKNDQNSFCVQQDLYLNKLEQINEFKQEKNINIKKLNEIQNDEQYEVVEGELVSPTELINQQYNFNSQNQNNFNAFKSSSSHQNKITDILEEETNYQEIYQLQDNNLQIIQKIDNMQLLPYNYDFLKDKPIQYNQEGILISPEKIKQEEKEWINFKEQDHETIKMEFEQNVLRNFKSMEVNYDQGLSQDPVSKDFKLNVQLTFSQENILQFQQKMIKDYYSPQIVQDQEQSIFINKNNNRILAICDENQIIKSGPVEIIIDKSVSKISQNKNNRSKSSVMFMQDNLKVKKKDSYYRKLKSTSKNKQQKEKMKLNLENEKQQNNGFENSPLQNILETGRLNKKFKNIEKIGQGGFGKVFKAMYHIDQKVYAIKVVRLHILKSKLLDPIIEIYQHRVYRELQTASRITSENIVRYFNSWFEELDDQDKIEEEKYKQGYQQMMNKNKQKKRQYNNQKSLKSSSFSSDSEKNQFKNLNFDKKNSLKISREQFNYSNGQKKYKLNKNNNISNLEIKQSIFLEKRQIITEDLDEDKENSNEYKEQEDQKIEQKQKMEQNEQQCSFDNQKKKENWKKKMKKIDRQNVNNSKQTKQSTSREIQKIKNQSQNKKYSGRYSSPQTVSLKSDLTVSKIKKSNESRMSSQKKAKISKQLRSAKSQQSSYSSSSYSSSSSSNQLCTSSSCSSSSSQSSSSQQTNQNHQSACIHFNNQNKKQINTESPSSVSESYEEDQSFSKLTLNKFLKTNQEYHTLNIMIQMEYCSGNSLEKFLKERNQSIDLSGLNKYQNGITLNIRKQNIEIFAQIMKGMEDIHKQNIIHRDLKPENIFIDFKNEQIKAKIGDFGLSRMLNPNQNSGQFEQFSQERNFTDLSSSRMNNSLIQKTKQRKNENLQCEENKFDCIKIQSQYSSIAGTEAYMAPEIKKHFQAGTFPLKGQDIEINKKQDIYQLGLILYELSHPIKTNMERNILFRKLNNERLLSHTILQDQMNNIELQLIYKMTENEPSLRPTASQVIQEWLEKWKIQLVQLEQNQ